ncbi:MAG: cyclase family protein [Phycisphaerales bacterium]|nr:cyclase family protein [Phycisphaerales bacterium]MCB9837189.1 cyclase family protein [Phycisphaera sp.]
MIYDISPPLTPKTAVFPGDTPLSREVLLDMKRGDNLTLSTLHGTVHLGAHADGANHYGIDAPAIDKMPLEHFLGTCEVIECNKSARDRIEHGDLLTPIDCARVLFKTGSWPDDEVFNTDYKGLAGSLVEHCASRGVITIGVDTPSVDTADSKDLPAHKAILSHNIAILEGLDLSEVPPGSYELIALPLRLVGFDASPVRAILRTHD